MDLETVKKSEVSQKGTVKKSEVSQKEKNKYHILTHIYGIQKNAADEPICKAQVETWMQTCGHRGRWGGWDELGDCD